MAELMNKWINRLSPGEFIRLMLTVVFIVAGLFYAISSIPASVSTEVEAAATEPVSDDWVLAQSYEEGGAKKIRLLGFKPTNNLRTCGDYRDFISDSLATKITMSCMRESTYETLKKLTVEYIEK